METLEARLLGLGDEPRRRNLQTLLDRLRAEIAMDVDGIMQALAPGFTLETHRSGSAPLVTSRESLGKLFRAMAAQPSSSAWVDVDQLAVDDAVLMINGTVHIRAGDARADDYPAVLVFEFEDGLMTREIVQKL